MIIFFLFGFFTISGIVFLSADQWQNEAIREMFMYVLFSDPLATFFLVVDDVIITFLLFYDSNNWSLNSFSFSFSLGLSLCLSLF